MKYPEEIVEEVRLRNDIVDVVGSRVKLQRKGSSYFGLCPFHSEKSPSFSVSPSKQIFYCFGCGAGGNVISFVMKYENYTFQEAVKLLADRAGIKLPEVEYSKEQKEKEAKRTKILEANLEAAKYFYYQLRGKNGEAGLNYLKSRALTEETMNKFGLGFSLMTPNDLSLYLKSKGFTDEIIREAGLATFDEKYGMQDKFWNRVMYPIQDINHRVIAFGGRVMSDAKPKYLNSPETMVFDKGRNLYGLNFARTSRKNRFIICEGYMDVIAMHQAGFTEAVASLGTAFTSGQAQILKRYSENIYLAYDSDGAGITAALRNIKILRDAGMVCKVINMQPYKDPDEFIKNLGADEYQKRIDNAENSFFFEVRMLERDYDLKDPDGRTRFIREVAAKLVGFEDEIERENYIRAMAERYELSYDTMKKQVVAMAAQNGGEYKPIERPKSGITSRDQKEDAIFTSFRLLLTWLCEEPGIYKIVKEYISVDDFTDPVYKEVAGWVFSDIESGNVNPGAYVSRFEEEDKQAVCAAIFNTKFEWIDNKSEKEQALHDIVYKIRRHSLDELAKKPDQSIEEIMKVIAGKKDLEELAKTTFKLEEGY
ncbi:MAG: DNA primase [Lachnospiraceae bacterium]|nr:DNA primase [Lachnospiraceae bacterium]